MIYRIWHSLFRQYTNKEHILLPIVQDWVFVLLVHLQEKQGLIGIGEKEETVTSNVMESPTVEGERHYELPK